MYTVKLSFENGRKENGRFDTYDEALSFIAENPEAGFMIWDGDSQVNEADVARDVELVSAS